MPRVVEIDPPDRIPVPDVLAAAVEFEAQAKEILRPFGVAHAEEIKTAIHSRSGVLSTSVASSVVSLPKGGVRLRFGSIRNGVFATRNGRGGAEAKRQDVFYRRFVDQGTGIYGPKSRKIVKRGLIWQGGVLTIPSGAGQKPQRMFERSAHKFDAEIPGITAEIDAVLTRAIDGRRR